MTYGIRLRVDHMPTSRSQSAADTTLSGLIKDNQQTACQLNRRQKRSRCPGPLQRRQRNLPLLLDELVPSTAQVGALNTVAVRDERLVGFNTDCSGFARGCRRAIGDVEGQIVALIGAGGVGKAIGVALADSRVARINIVDRQVPKAQELAEALSQRCAASAAPVLARRSPASMVSSTPPQSECCQP